MSRLNWITNNGDKIKNWLDSSEAAPISDDPNFSSSYTVSGPGNFIKEVYNLSGKDQEIQSANFENYPKVDLA